MQATKVPSHGNAHDYLGGDEPADAPGLEAAIITTGSFQRRPRGLADGASAARLKNSGRRRYKRPLPAVRLRAAARNDLKLLGCRAGSISIEDLQYENFY